MARWEAEQCVQLVLIQPWMETRDYRTEHAFRQKLEAYFRMAERAGMLTQGSLVLLPEHLGTWLVAVEEWPAVYEAETIAAAMRRIVATNLFDFVGSWRRARVGPHHVRPRSFARARAAIFLMKADRMWTTYRRAFRALAARYGVYVIAGSIVLPDTSGSLTNQSFLFTPQGQVHSLSRKAYPTRDEQTFVAAASPQAAGVWHLPQGRIAHLICADAWYPQPYGVLRKQRPDWVLVSAYIAGDSLLAQPWGGYDGFAAPPDVDPADVGVLTEGAAWRKYALEGRLARAGASCGAMVVLRGRLWDLGSDGQTFILKAGRTFAPPGCDSACILATCLECR